MSFFFNLLFWVSLICVATFLTVWSMSFRVVETLILLGEKLGCYKISLECKDPLLSYYTQFGFKLEQGQNYLCKRFYHWELNAMGFSRKNPSLPLCPYQMIFSTNLKSTWISSLWFFSCEIFSHTIHIWWYVNYPIVQKYKFSSFQVFYCFTLFLEKLINILYKKCRNQRSNDN